MNAHASTNMILDGQKLLWHPERLAAWRRGERIAPVTIDCSLTRACTYRCVYCYSQLQYNSGSLLDWEVISRFLDDCAEIGVKAVSFVSDGESTCSPHLYKAIVYGKQNGLDIALGTNGCLLADERLVDILPALTYIRFNITAAEPGRYAFIHGCKEENFFKVLATIRNCVKIKHELGLTVTIGLQMVFMPEFADQVLPLSRLGLDLGVDYLVIKHCSDDENGRLGVEYARYADFISLLQQAEGYSTQNYLVKAKWTKILSNGLRSYSRCYGPPFILQLSGSGLVAPCGMLFNERYKEFHIGNIASSSFKDIWRSERYWQIMERIASDRFDARTMCGTLCLQHKVNEYLWDIRQQGDDSIVSTPAGHPAPMHLNFI